MDWILNAILTESWLIYFLFTIIVGWWVRKWIPFIIKRFDKMNEDFRISLKSQQETFERTLRSISDDFIKQIQKSESWHERHDQKLDEILNNLKK